MNCWSGLLKQLELPQLLLNWSKLFKVKRLIKCITCLMCPFLDWVPAPVFSGPLQVIPLDAGTVWTLRAQSRSPPGLWCSLVLWGLTLPLLAARVEGDACWQSGERTSEGPGDDGGGGAKGGTSRTDRWIRGRLIKLLIYFNEIKIFYLSQHERWLLHFHKLSLLKKLKLKQPHRYGAQVWCGSSWGLPWRLLISME